LDEELKNLILAELPKQLRPIFISSITEENLQQLKDQIWQLLNRAADE
jgi:GTP-binding protein